MVIAGYDPTGGAGVLADMRAIRSVGARGYFITSCITFQTPDEVISIQPLNPEEILSDVEKTIKKFRPEYCKLGMLYSKKILHPLSDILSDENIKVVADPVFRASDGSMLCEKGYIKEYRKIILPITYLLTPNLQESLMLTGMEDAKAAAQALCRYGAQNVLIKGGDINGKNSIDILFDGRRFSEFSLPKIKGRFHGTGCIFSSIIAANLSKGKNLRTSIDEAKRILWGMMINSYRLNGFKSRILGECKDIDIPPKSAKGERFEVWFSLNRVVKKLVRVLPDYAIPEVGINFGYAVKKARDKRDVCALVRRIDRSRILNKLDFGASTHISRVILTAMKFNPDMRSALNLKYDGRLIDESRKIGMKVGCFDREEEPEGVSTMEWGTKKVIEEFGEVPDLIYDRGSVGKEPMIRLLGRNPEDLLRKIKSILC